MDNHVCVQQSKEEGIGEATKTIIRNLPNPPTTEDIDNICHAEMVKALTHRAALIRRAELLQKATIIELKRRAMNFPCLHCIATGQMSVQSASSELK